MPSATRSPISASDHGISRRRFLKQSAACCAGFAASALTLCARAPKGPNDRIVLAVIGCNGRGMDHIAGHLASPNTEIAYVCDVDSRALAKGIAAASKKQQRTPMGAKDLRRVLDDMDVDAVSIATPDHWHTPAAMLVCAAGKHVYVEKPGSHNAHESQIIVAAAKHHGRLVQMGNQRRSWPWVIEAMNALHSGELGRLFFARAWYTNHRPSIGHGKPVPVPGWLDYSLWQGPAPERPYKDNLLHYNWHWFWNWGTGELGNNGIHALDLARWGLGVAAPARITCSGGRYHYQDDWETPDTCVASFDFGDKGITWEGRSCDPRGFEGAKFGVAFYGEKGSLVIAGNDYSIYDLNDKEVRSVKGKGDDVLHFANFHDAIRNGRPLNSPIEEGQQSSLLCHLGNIAWRTGHAINFDPKIGKITGDHAATALWSRQYRRGWEPKV